MVAPGWCGTSYGPLASAASLDLHAPSIRRLRIAAPRRENDDAHEDEEPGDASRSRLLADVEGRI
jgi:hypothetical protein